jgi:excisionase family DNA binding protein
MAATDQDIHMLTIAEAAALLKVGRSTVNRWLRDGRLPAYRVGPKAVRIRRGDLERIMMPMSQAGKEPMGDEGRNDVRATIRPLTNEQAAEQRAAFEASKAHLERMRSRYGGAPRAESWPIIREARDERAARI